MIEDWEDAQKIEAWAHHVKSTDSTDIQYPIWMTQEGHVFDGVHRLTRAVIENHLTIKVKIFDEISKSIEPIEDKYKHFMK